MEASIREADGYVYVLSAGPYVKVGRTKAPDRRIKALKIQLPFPVEVDVIIPCEDHVAAERYLHHFMRRERANGEWFDLSGDPYMLPFLRDIGWISLETDGEEGYCIAYDVSELEDAA